MSFVEFILGLASFFSFVWVTAFIASLGWHTAKKWIYDEV